MNCFFKVVCIIVFAFCKVSSIAQHQNDNWYFGRNAGISFTSGAPSVFSHNPMYTRASACISHNSTGQLQFYTDGISVWNRNHTIMANGNSISTETTAGGVLIVPYPGKNNQYYIFTVSAQNVIGYAIVDMSLDGGLGDVIAKQIILATHTSSAITAVKHEFNNNYWLITHYSNATSPTNGFFVYLITENGIKTTPIISNAGPLGSRFADLVSNHSGKKLAITHYADTNNAFAATFDFDKQCGYVYNPVTLYKDKTWDYAYGAAFSPDDSMLYIAYGYIESQLVQYEVSNYTKWTVVATDAQNFNDIQVGPDGKLYISTHDGNIPSPVVDALNYPNNSGLAVGYTQNALHLGASKNGNFEFPNFVTDISTPTPTGPQALSILHKNTCIGDTTVFSIAGNSSLADSVRWHFDDGFCLPEENTSTLLAPTHMYSQPGEYWPTLQWYRCGIEQSMSKKIKISNPSPVFLGSDTILCFGDSMVLHPKTPGAIHLWSTGENTDSIQVSKAGTYWVKVQNGNCSGSDTITIKQLPPILIEIGNQFTICDDDNELVKLDAGKGYHNYLWTPTGDTTQWIIVKQVGDYYVVVEDFRGCKGDDDAKVLRQCDFTFFIPNSFTPNGDGLNDVFAPTFTDITEYQIEIYNTWGEKIFESNNPTKGWDGTYKNQAAPIGAYIWQVKYKGFHNKLLRNYNHKGFVNLVR